MRASTTLVLTTTIAVAACGGAEPPSVGPGDAVPLPAVERVESAPPAVERIPPPALAAPAPVRQAAALAQPAIWPADDVVFATPEEAAADFVRTALVNGEDPALGAFEPGDTGSGEIRVDFPGESAGATPSPRGRLLMRQLGDDDGWFVIAAVSDGATITTPSAGAVVPAGPLTVEGEARGFEGTVVVSAFSAGDRATEFDSQLVRGGTFADLEPYSTSLDLSDGVPGETVVVLVQGDVGLETDPGDFAAIPVVIEDVIPPTR